MIALVAQSEVLCVENRKRLATSHKLIAQSRRLLNHAWEMSGASDGIDLGVIVRERLASGWLFPAPHKVWAGKGTGHICVVCGITIGPSEVEHEVVGPTTVWSHLPCYSIWREESRTYQGANGIECTDHLADLRQIVRNRFGNGSLFVLPHDKSWTGRGVSDICVVCNQPIFAAESSQEVIGVRRAHVHLVCYRAWLLESIAIQQSRDGASAARSDGDPL